MRNLLVGLCALLIAGCAQYDYSSSVELGQPLLNFAGESLAGEPVTLPGDLRGQPAILLFGYVHKSQFDIDRWLIGLDMRANKLAILEIPAIKNPFVRWFSSRIDESMREGIPRELWSSVVTVYADGDAVQQFTGNQAPKNARVMVIDRAGNVQYFYDRGFSVEALNQLLSVSQRL
ncbi:hypothetical protein [Alteromonas flava]|uniref:hypothetical protein n=1 Tax=Alteromonas flava TaxID=2048003 RepID=UPI000C28E830|nr:hypothetical protein [Alteromonas flava]